MQYVLSFVPDAGEDAMMTEEDSKTDNEGVARLKQHAGLVQKLVKQVPAALANPGLTLEQLSKLNRLIQRGIDDFKNVQTLVNEPGLEGTYKRAASSLEKIWLHLSSATEARMNDLAKNESYESGSEKPG